MSCKKEKGVDGSAANAKDPVSTGASREQLILDSIFLYAREVYLWNTSLPAYNAFNPRRFSATLAGYDQELNTIAQYSPANPATGKSYEYDPNGSGYAKYSYINDISSHNLLAIIKKEKSNIDLVGIGNDFGLKIGAYIIEGTSKYTLLIQAVYKNSPADLNNLTRGCKITGINGTFYGANIQNESAGIAAALNNPGIILEGIGKDGITPFKVVLNATQYQSSPVYSAKVLEVNGVKIGYLAYAQFSSLTNSKPALDAAFAEFSSKGITKLVLDLRYNGGGYVNTAEYMTNLILSSNTTGKVMFIEHYNNLMQSGEAKILSNQPLFNEDGSYHYIKGRVANYGDLDKDYFSEAKQVTYINKKGPLEGITDVVFIVTRSTASASELVINNLKPYINVKIVGTNSYGKPVGFFPITISYKLDAETKKETGYDIYYSMFKITNALAQGDYFDGFKPDLFIDTDDADHDFGDLNENNLVRALTLMVPNFSVLSKMSIQGKKKLTAAATVRTILNPNEFIGMIADKPVLKK